MQSAAGLADRGTKGLFRLPGDVAGNGTGTFQAVSGKEQQGKGVFDKAGIPTELAVGGATDQFQIGKGLVDPLEQLGEVGLHAGGKKESSLRDDWAELLPTAGDDLIDCGKRINIVADPDGGVDH
jgi:hypothetical protein